MVNLLLELDLVVVPFGYNDILKYKIFQALD